MVWSHLATVKKQYFEKVELITSEYLHSITTEFKDIYKNDNIARTQQMKLHRI